MAASESKGAALERRVARLEFAEGALVVLRFPVREPQSDRAHVITDVDVLSLDFDLRLRAVASIFECKSVRGQKAEADRLLTLAGLKKYVGADRAALVRETATSRGRAIARRLGVELIDQGQIAELEVPHVWVPAAFGPVAGERALAVHQDVVKTLKSIGDFPFSLLEYLRFDAILDPPYRVLGALVTLRDHLAHGTVLPRRVEGTLVSDALLALTVAALRTAGRLDAIGPRETRKLIENGVMSGNPHDDSLLRVAALADALMRDQVDRVHRIYTESGAKKQIYKVASVREAVGSSPAWLGRFMDLVVRMRSRQPIARELPQVIQLVCFDALVGDQNFRAPSFDHLFTLEHRQLLSVAIETLGDILGVEMGVLSGVRALDFERGGQTPDRVETFEAPRPSGKLVLPGQDELFSTE